MSRSRPSSVAGAAVLVTMVTIVSAVLGLGRDIVIAAVFGAGGDMDGYFVALGLMNVVLGLLASATSKAAVPVLSRQSTESDGVRLSGQTLSVAISVVVVGLGLATILMQLVVGNVVAVVAPGFGPVQAESAEHLTRIVLIATVLIAGTNLLAAAAQARRRFFWSAVQGIPFNVVMIGSAAIFGPDHGVTALAWGFVAGSAARLLVQIPPLRQLRIRLRPSLRLSDPGFVSMFRLVPPMLVGSAIGNVNTLVDRAVGSAIGDGVISSLSYAWRLVGLADTVLIASLVVALYPALSTAAADPGEMKRLVDRGLSATMVILVPTAITLVVAAGSVAEAVFQRGAFTTADTELTATALRWYAPAVLALGWREVVVRASYALDDSRRPLAVAVVAMSVNVVGDLTLGLAFGVPGLAASTSASLLVAAAANTWLLARRHHAVNMPAMRGILRRTMFAGVVAGAVAVATAHLPVSTHPLLETATVGGGCILAFVLVTLALRGPEADVLRSVPRLLRRTG